MGRHVGFTSRVPQGDAGIKPNQLYLELGLHGEDRKAQAEALGVQPGDPVLLDRPIRRSAAPDTFSGAYLDNGIAADHTDTPIDQISWVSG